jgi:hypothetical protein
LFGTVDDLGAQRVTLVKDEARALHFCRLAGYRGPPAPNASAP